MVQFGCFTPTPLLSDQWVDELVTSRISRPPFATGIVETVVGEAPPCRGGKATIAQVVTPPVCFSIPEYEETWCDTLGRTLKQAFMRCFGFGGAVQMWERERAFDHAVRDERVTTLSHYANHTVTETVVADTHSLNEERVHQVPRFVGHAVDVLRVKLGMGAADRSVPGNVALVRAEAAKLMRDWNVRHRDAAAHLLLIERAFFTEGVHERPITWRVDCTRKSRLMAFFLGRSDSSPKFDY